MAWLDDLKRHSRKRAQGDASGSGFIDGLPNDYRRDPRQSAHEATDGEDGQHWRGRRVQFSKGQLAGPGSESISW
ncbi:hypothetical protein CCMA1212_008345 [Trichoderma ghanense]|uniref:Uncharacterized protein n=1 Tax=Trichoderma ghanense TaxID=65468 RepID=A0ABY2GVY5_9HYPO